MLLNKVRHSGVEVLLVSSDGGARREQAAAKSALVGSTSASKTGVVVTRSVSPTAVSPVHVAPILVRTCWRPTPAEVAAWHRRASAADTGSTSASKTGVVVTRSVSPTAVSPVHVAPILGGTVRTPSPPHRRIPGASAAQPELNYTPTRPPLWSQVAPRGSSKGPRTCGGGCRSVWAGERTRSRGGQGGRTAGVASYGSGAAAAAGEMTRPPPEARRRGRGVAAAGMPAVAGRAGERTRCRGGGGWRRHHRRRGRRGVSDGCGCCAERVWRRGARPPGRIQYG